MRFIYSWLTRAAAPIAFAVVLWRGVRERSYWQGLAERFGLGKKLPAPSIWLHAVSLGEMSAAAPLVRALHSRYPQLALAVTAATPAGRARARDLFADVADIRFLPYDTPGSVRRFLERIRPRVAVIMETELWPNLFRECERRRVPVFLASARLSAKSVSRYRRLGSLFSSVFTPNVTVAAQSAEDAERFRLIGASANQTRVIGNVKYDLAVSAAIIETGRVLRAAYGSKLVWAAGSTHAGEEEQVLEAHALLQAQRPDSLLLLAPRHRDRFAAVADLLARRGAKFARRSDMARGLAEAGSPIDSLPADAQVLLVDTIGELLALYASADVAFVGGSLVPIGGHNLLEPAALGLPVLTGPSHFNGKEIALLLLQRGAALQVANPQELAAALQRLLDEPAERRRIGGIGKDIVESNRGSVERLLALIEPSLPEAHQS
ncbi:MAG TPA: lipid IV(A) 3-deoxy-D-manno-octulosonic acid transferase [Steroidobacteraceae bacterium]|nr:lipid IV(A) 3-deoxy-D-manno-octulosonic acid transferase [Steroidobacteraceae bacterium]